VAIIFALSLIPMTLVIGAAVDFRRQVTTKSFVQEAADAAVLSAAKAYFKNASAPAATRSEAANAAAGATITASLAARASLVESLDWSQSVDTDTGEIAINVSGASPTAFGTFFGISSLPFSVEAHAAAGGKPVEIALILDNTSSMFTNSRFSLMRSAAKAYVNEVYDLGGDRVKIGVVPWTTVVNINSEAVAAADASAVAATTPPIYGTRRTPVTPAIDRLSVLAEPRKPAVALTQVKMTAYAAPVEWRGCVRSANNEVKVSASGTVTTAISDAAPPTRFPVALLEPSYAPGNISYCTGISYVPPAPPPPPGPPPPPAPPPSPPPPPAPPPPPPPPPPAPLGLLDSHQSAKAVQTAAGSSKAVNPAWMHQTMTFTSVGNVCNGWVDSGMVYCSTSSNWHANGTRNAYFEKSRPCTNSVPYPGAPTQAGTLYACVSDPNEIKYLANGGKICGWEVNAFPGYPGSTAPNWTSAQPISGPNLNCPVSILPISSNRKQVLDKLDEMYPVPGGTQADVGLLWGLRILSPGDYWKGFWGLSDAQKPVAYKSPNAYKIAIILSDGKNEAPTQYEGYYGCTDNGRGYLAGNCWKSPNVPTLNNTAANNMTLSACKTMRDTYGIDLYFILVDVDDTAAKKLASDCAPDPGHAISTTSTGLSDVFKGLVSRNLRLSH
jgi:hypothetical protein